MSRGAACFGGGYCRTRERQYLGLAEASGSMRVRLVTLPPSDARCGSGRPPSAHLRIQRPRLDGRVSQSPSPMPPRRPRHPRRAGRRGSRPIRQRRRPAPQAAAPRLREGVLRLGDSCCHFRPGGGAEQACGEEKGSWEKGSVVGKGLRGKRAPSPFQRQVTEELRSVYTLAYYPRNQTFEGQWRKVEVRVKRPGVVVRTRDGYLAR